MATLTITSSSFGGIGAVVQGDVPATLTIDIGVPGPGVPLGGLEGQILAKASDTNYDTVWQDNYATELRIVARNETGSTLAKGTVVYINGAAGNKPTLAKALATGDATSAQTVGMVSDDILNNQNGEVTVRGLLTGLDTSAFAAGTQLYLSGTTAGSVTSSKPVAPIHLVYVGIVSRQHANQGQIEVAVQNGYELDELHDVKITSVSNGQVLKYDSAQGLWVNGTDSSGVAWGGITGTLSAQTDLQTALDAKATAADFLSKAGNLSGLADLATSRSNLGLGTMATATASDYSTTTVANGLYYPLSSNPAGYLTSASLTGYATESWVTTELGSYLTTASASSTYLTQANAATTYYPLTGNPSGFLTSASLSGYATESWVTTQLGSYLTTSAAASTYQTQAGMSSYLTTSAASSTYLTQANAATTYYPLTGNPSGFLTSAPVTSVAGKTGAVTLTNSDISGLGTMATATATDYLAKAGNLSGLADLATSRSNLGLGTMATETASNYLTTSAASSTYLTQANAASTYQTQAGMSSYLTTSAAASTYQTISGMSSYLTTSAASSTYAPLASPALTGTPTAPTAAVDTNTTQVATTAYVIGQGYLKSATASSTYAPLASPALTGTPTAPTASAGTNTTQIATTAFVQQEVPDFAATSDIASPSSTTKVVSPNDVVKMITNRAFFDTKAHSGSFSTSGTGAEAYKATNDRLIAVGTPSVGVAGYGQHMFDTTASSWGILGAKRGSNHYTQDFSKKIWASGTCMFYAIGDSATTARVMIGGRAGYGTGNPTKPSIGWKLVGGGSNAIVLVTYGYNGSASVVTETTSSFTPVVNQSFDWAIYHEPNTTTPSLSKAYLYINDNLVATGENSPADTTVNYNYFLEGCESTGSHATRMAFWSFPTMIWWSRS